MGDRFSAEFYEEGVLPPSDSDGSPKDFTDRCKECDFYREVEPNDDGVLGECYWSARRILKNYGEGSECGYISILEKSPRGKRFREKEGKTMEELLVVDSALLDPNKT